MERFTYTDGDKIGVYDGERAKLYESEYIVRYREYAETRKKNDEWKYTGEGARFRGDFDTYRGRQERIDAYVNGVQFDGEKVLYSFTVNGSSGVYRKDITQEKAREEHIFSSADCEILSISGRGDLLAVTVRGRDVTSQIGTLNCATSELRTLTDGDARDGNACFSPVDGKILFDSAGVGRTADGTFSGKYSPSAICSFDCGTLEITELKRDAKYSYVKPKQSRDGTLYCIRRPNKERRGNPLLEIVLIPVRILQAIVMFIQSFVMMFTGKSLTSDGSNPAKGRESDSRKLYVDGNLIEAEKELKRNRKFRDREYGFIPRSWKLVKCTAGGDEELRDGICDFALCRDGGIYCTDGKHVFYVKDGKTKKIVDTDLCLSVATENVAGARDDTFSL